jgi:hypothetical protein
MSVTGRPSLGGPRGRRFLRWLRGCLGSHGSPGKRELIDHLFHPAGLAGEPFHRGLLEVGGHAARQDHHALLRVDANVARLEHRVLEQLRLDVGDDSFVIRRLEQIHSIARAEQQRDGRNRSRKTDTPHVNLRAPDKTGKVL